MFSQINENMVDNRAGNEQQLKNQRIGSIRTDNLKLVE